MAQTDMVQQEVHPSEEWTTGLCDCCKDTSTCCYGLWCCPCMACSTTKKFGECMCLPLVDILGTASAVAFGIPKCAPPAALSIRVAVRHKYRIKGSLCNDIAISCCCDWCSWCQIARELKHRQRSPAVINVQPVVVSMQPTPTVTTQTNMVNQSFGGPLPEYGPSAPEYWYLFPSGPPTASEAGYGPPPPSGPGYGYQPPIGPAIFAEQGYAPPSYTDLAGPMIPHKY